MIKQKQACIAGAVLAGQGAQDLPDRRV